MKSIIENIELKLVKLIQVHNEMKEHNRSLEISNKTLKESLQTNLKEIASLNDKVKLMNISKSINSSNKDLKEIRLEINKYVREIDKCIALLNK